MSVKKLWIVMAGISLLVAACTPGLGMPSVTTATSSGAAQQATGEQGQVPVTGGETETVRPEGQGTGGATQAPGTQGTPGSGQQGGMGAGTQQPGGLDRTGTADWGNVDAQGTEGAPSDDTLSGVELGDLPAATFLLAQQLLSSTLNVAQDTVQLRELEEVEWNDTCLEAPFANENCAQRSTRGFRMVLDVAGQPFEFRTDQSGANIRLAQGGTRLQELALMAQLMLSSQLGTDVSNLRIVSLQRTTFADACLGVQQTGQSCAQVRTPGFQLVFQAGSQQFEFRASEAGQLMLVPSADVQASPEAEDTQETEGSPEEEDTEEAEGTPEVEDTEEVEASPSPGARTSPTP